MENILEDESKFKNLLKQTILEIIKEEKELFSDLLTEIIEDIAMTNAIKSGEHTVTVDRETIFNILDNDRK